MTTTYCITGISGYIGKLLAQRLAQESGTNVIGIDLNAPADLPNIKFYKNDIRDPAIGDMIKSEKVDVVIHLAFYTPPEGDAALAESINVTGTQNILQAAGSCGIKRFVLASSAAAYGSHPDNPVPMTESHPLRPNKYFYYSDHKAAQEKMIRVFKQQHPEIQTIVLRPCVLIGPHIENPTGDSLKQKLLLFIKGRQPPIQFIYEDDAAHAFYLAAKNDGEGVYNIAGDGTLTYPDIARLMNKKILLLPFGVLSVLANIGKWMNVSPVSATTLSFIRNPIIVDPSNFNRDFNFKPNYDTRQALMEFKNSS